MNEEEFGTLLDLYMVSDPWPLPQGNQVLGDFLDRSARRRGFDNWIHAYHAHARARHECESKTTTRSDSSDAGGEASEGPGMGYEEWTWAPRPVYAQAVAELERNSEVRTLEVRVEVYEKVGEYQRRLYKGSLGTRFASAGASLSDTGLPRGAEAFYRLLTTIQQGVILNLRGWVKANRK